MSIESEHADMTERLRAIAHIVSGGNVAALNLPGMVRPTTPGCNCDANGILSTEVHAFGCPYTPALKPVTTVKSL